MFESLSQSEVRCLDSALYGAERENKGMLANLNSPVKANLIRARLTREICEIRNDLYRERDGHVHS